MKRYNVPRISFINKMDRQGSNPWKVIDQIRHKLKKPAAAVQVPIGSEGELKGVVDLLRMKAIYNEGPKGCVSGFSHLPLDSASSHKQSTYLGVGSLGFFFDRITVRETDEIPADVLPLAQEKRLELIEHLAEVDEQMSDLFLDEAEITPVDIASAIRRATIANDFTPVFLGSALANTGVQAMLDGVIAYLPDPSEVPNQALDTELPPNAPPVPLVPAAKAPLVGLAFKLEEGRFGQLTYMRIYQGTLKRGMTLFNARTGKKIKVPRLVRMHSADMEVRVFATA